MRQHLVHDPMSSDGRKCRRTLSAQHDQVSLLRIALIEELFSWIAGYDDGLDGDLPSHDVVPARAGAMSTGIAEAPRTGVDWRRAELVLTVLAFVGFVTLPIRITNIYSGLPAHPLFVHVPVILIPTTVVAAVVFVVKPAWLLRYGIALAVVSIAAMSSIFLTMQAGAALRGELNLRGEAAKLISEHSQAAHILAIVYVAFTAVLILTFAAQRISGGMPTGLGIVDRVLSSRSIYTALRVVLALVSIGAAYMVFRTGDLGAKAVWQGRVQATHGGGPGAGRQPFPPDAGE